MPAIITKKIAWGSVIKFFPYLLDDSTQAFGVRGKVLRTNDVSTGLTETAKSSWQNSFKNLKMEITDEIRKKCRNSSAKKKTYRPKQILWLASIFSARFRLYHDWSIFLKDDVCSAEFQTRIIGRKLFDHNWQTNEPVKFKYSTMQPLKTLKPFELTWPLWI